MIVGTLAASGTLGILIPPSIMMIVYGFVAEVSIARLFIAGVVPGILMVLLFMSVTGVSMPTPPGIATVRPMRNTGMGASGEIRLTSP